MYENNKLDEAGFFYSRMISEVDDRESFIYHLSAFLSSARSVLQYALKEVESKKGGQQWYSDHMNSSPVLSFFKDKRNINIHKKPVVPLSHYTIDPPPIVIHLSISAAVVICDKNGNVTHQEEAKDSKQKPEELDTPGKVEIRYTFADWKGTEDVLNLSKMYLDELRKVVEDSVKNGFLTG